MSQLLGTLLSPFPGSFAPGPSLVCSSANRCVSHGHGHGDQHGGGGQKQPGAYAEGGEKQSPTRKAAWLKLRWLSLQEVWWIRQCCSSRILPICSLEAADKESIGFGETQEAGS